MSKEISKYVSNECEDGSIRQYVVSELWELTKDEPVFDIGIDIVIPMFNSFINDFTSDDWYRVINADLSYPIIVNDTYGILDGCHRTVKAMMLGMETIRAVRLNDLPEPNKVWANWDELKASHLEETGVNP